MLLDAFSIQQARVLNSVTNGYHETQTDMHGSAFSSDLRIYRYNGREYRFTDCFRKDYYVTDDDKGEVHVNPKPVIKRFACRK